MLAGDSISLAGARYPSIKWPKRALLAKATAQVVSAELVMSKAQTTPRVVRDEGRTTSPHRACKVTEVGSRISTAVDGQAVN